MKKRFKIEGMHCSSCAMLIEMELEDLAGIKNANANFAKAVVEVEMQDSLDDSEIIRVIKKAGYNALPLESN